VQVYTVVHLDDQSLYESFSSMDAGIAFKPSFVLNRYWYIHRSTINIMGTKPQSALSTSYKNS